MWSSEEETDRTAAAHSLDLNRAIACKGNIGRQRQEFCVEYIKDEARRLGEIELEQAGLAASGGETVACHKGCCYCCSLYVEAGIQECEAIVHYLYRREDVLAAFVSSYAEWRESSRKNGDIFRTCGQISRRRRVSGDAGESLQAYADALLLYKMQDIACPFLHNRLCLIYEVRPESCAAHCVTSPPEWCSPFDPHQPRVLHASGAENAGDLSFYYGRLRSPAISFLPVTVYGILTRGYAYLAGIPGLEGMVEEATNDPEVRAVLVQYR
jgi:hypothetical protein